MSNNSVVPSMNGFIYQNYKNRLAPFDVYNLLGIAYRINYEFDKGLAAFEKYGRRISPHGAGWKQTFREMLLESLTVYAEDLRPIIQKFSKSPKANFMASPDLVKYFHVPEEDELLYLESLIVGDVFVLKNKVFVIEETTKKRYLCRNLKSGLKYKVNTLARVRKIDNQYEKQ